jgi:hypothetical protein
VRSVNEALAALGVASPHFEALMVDERVEHTL